jgi:hypothetical protein
MSACAYTENKPHNILNNTILLSFLNLSEILSVQLRRQKQAWRDVLTTITETDAPKQRTASESRVQAPQTHCNVF